MRYGALEFFRLLVPQLPLLAVYLVGLVICAMKWSRYPRPMQLAFLGTLFLLIDLITQPIVHVVIIRNLETSEVNDMTSMLAMVSAIVRLTGYGFLLGAVFISRNSGALSSRQSAMRK